MLIDNESPKSNEISAVHHLGTDRQVIENARAAAEEEKAMGFKEVMRIHWKAAMWSCIFSLALVMEGYDLGIVSEITESGWTG
jgi:SP family general alpha glucoside:H+ symporter-like MFS transporter